MKKGNDNLGEIVEFCRDVDMCRMSSPGFTVAQVHRRNWGFGYWSIGNGGMGVCHLGRNTGDLPAGKEQ